MNKLEKKLVSFVKIIGFPAFELIYCKHFQIWKEEDGGIFNIFLGIVILILLMLSKTVITYAKKDALLSEPLKTKKWCCYADIITYVICFGAVLILREQIMNGTKGIYNVRVLVGEYTEAHNTIWTRIYSVFGYCNLAVGLMQIIYMGFITYVIPTWINQILCMYSGGVERREEKSWQSNFKDIFMLTNDALYFMVFPLFVFLFCDIMGIRNDYGIYFRWLDVFAILILFFAVPLMYELICYRETCVYYWNSITLNFVAIVICFLLVIFEKKEIVGLFELIHQEFKYGNAHLVGVLFCIFVMYIIPALIIKLCKAGAVKKNLKTEKKLAEEQKRIQEEERIKRIALEEEQRRIVEEQKRIAEEQKRIAEEKKIKEMEEARQKEVRRLVKELGTAVLADLKITAYLHNIKELKTETERIIENPIYLTNRKQLEILKDVKVLFQDEELCEYGMKIIRKQENMTYAIPEALGESFEEYWRKIDEKEKWSEDESTYYSWCRFVAELENNWSDYEELYEQWKELEKKYKMEYAALRLGAEGEEKVNNYLSKYASSLMYKENISLQYKNEKCEIDDIIIAPQGVFSIEVKNIGSTGKYSVEIDDTGRWQKILSNGEKSNMDYNAKRQNDMHQRIVEEIVNEALNRNIENRIFVQGIVIIANDEIDFVNHSKQKIYRIDGLIDEIRSYPPDCLKLEEMEQVAKALEAHRIETAKYPMIDYKTLFDKVNTFYAEILEKCKNMEIK